MQTEQRRIRLSEVDDETVQKIILLREQGFSHRRIAATVGLSHGSVMRLVKWQETGEKPKAAKAVLVFSPLVSLLDLNARFRVPTGTIDGAGAHEPLS
jgi:hypothetical protein